MILDLHRQGLSVTAIAERLGIDRKTVRKYIERGLEPPVYRPRPRRLTKVAPFARYLRDRVTAFPELTASRLMREIREMGYAGGYTPVKDALRAIRPVTPAGYEVRFETPPGRQAQADFAFFRVVFTDEPSVERIVWLFSLVLGRDLDDLSLQLRGWLDTVANLRVHATTHRVANEAFAQEKSALTPLPLVPYRAVLRLERRISHDGMISVGGNTYSAPDTTRRRVLEVHSLIDEIRIFEAGVLIATHAPLQGRHQVRIDPAHRLARQRLPAQPGHEVIVLGRAGDLVARRSLDFYDALGRVLAVKGHA